MEYNIHPIFVHFPIALLFVYSVLRVLQEPLQKWFPKVAWRQIGRALLVFGVLGSFAALLTGEMAEELTRPQHDLVEAHEMFANTTTWLYVVLLVGEIASYVYANFVTQLERMPVIKKIVALLERILCHKIVAPVLALVALTTLMLTGMLGGVMVYGTTADPFAQTVLNILGITL